MKTLHVQRAVGIASLIAALAHGGLAPAHFDEWWGYGAFFAFAATAQALFGLALLLDAVPRARDKRALYAAGVVGNLFLIGFYAWSRVVGVPLLGPAAGEVESVAPIDVVTKLLEVIIVVGSLALLRREFKTRGGS